MKELSELQEELINEQKKCITLLKDRVTYLETLLKTFKSN
jgi:hypothetical protein